MKICIWPNCQKTSNEGGIVREMCVKHYQRASKLGFPNEPWDVWESYRVAAPCAWMGCKCTEILARGLCNRHYQRSQKLGHPEDPWIAWDLQHLPTVCAWLDCDYTSADSRLKRGLCNRHYQRASLLGFPENPWLSWIPMIRRVPDDLVVPDGFKWCPNCNQVLHLKAYNLSSRTSFGRKSYCRRCQSQLSDPELDRLAGARKRAIKIGAYEEDVRVDVLLERQDGQCFYCLRDLDTYCTPRDPLYPNIEHMVPLSRGGSHSYVNCVLACKRCNGMKHAKPLDVWLEELHGQPFDLFLERVSQ